jgi:hypothetical protein
MGKKLSAFVACLAGTMLLIVPGAMAAITVTNIAPSSGQAGATVPCTVNGTFNVPLDVDVNGTTYRTPGFTLDNGVDPPILGTTDTASVTATSANVTFWLPVEAPAVWYTLRASQVRKIWIVTFTDTASLPHAFQVVPTISSLSPYISTTGVGDLTLTVNGSSFVDSSPGVDGSNVRWNGETLDTTFNSATRLTATVPAAKLTTVGTADVTVTNVTAGTTSAPATFMIDTTRPSTAALNAVSVKRNKTAKLNFRISEPAGHSPSAQVVLKIKARRGAAQRTITINNVPMNVTQTSSFKVTLKKGSYTWSVYATDLAGNTQANVATASFTVK